jgi:hypothetical protein
MLVAFSFQAKPGREREFEALLDQPEAGRAVAALMGGRRNTLFLGHGRMVRILEFPDGAKPTPLGEVARSNPAVAEFLRKLGPLIVDGFDMDRPETLAAFNDRMSLKLAYDVRT